VERCCILQFIANTNRAFSCKNRRGIVKAESPRMCLLPLTPVFAAASWALLYLLFDRAAGLLGLV
jgi:hypothetical protein